MQKAEEQETIETVTTDIALKSLIRDLAREPFVAIDTEFLRDTTYWPVLCLIQVATSSGRKAIIDPLTNLSLEPFLEFLSETSPVKVFHAARQDLEIFHHMGGVFPNPLYDTQIAAMVCGYGESVGYETLVRQIAKASIDKSARFTDWKRRPLSERQLAYAIADVTHLCTVYDALRRRVESQGRASWIDEEMQALEDPATYDLSPEAAWERLRLRDTRPRALAVAIEVAAWREREAQKRDVPRGRILKDDLISEVVHERPATKEALEKLRAVPRGWANSELAQGLVAAVKRGLERPTEGLPAVESRRREPLPPARIDLLKTLLRARSEEHHVAQKLIATSAELEAFAAGEPEGRHITEGWRHEIFGRDAERLLAGEVALALEGSAVQVVSRG
ncbi:MAG: ribonuclease D [Alphaproteobacteria bacterium]